MLKGRQPLLDLAGLHRGDSVEVHSPGRSPYVGIIDEAMPQLNIVWVRETTTGERKLLLVGESYLYRVQDSNDLP
jgi:hypothetical protein